MISKVKHNLKFYWSDILIAVFLVCAAILFGVVGQNSYIAIHDNLDLFQPQFQMMKDEGTFFAHGAGSGFLAGISRDVMPSEWSLTTFLYIIFPAFPAYIISLFAKILTGWFSGCLLADEVLGKESEKYHTIISLCSFAYGMINFFPCFGVPFASIPLVVFLILKIERAENLKKACPWFVALFAYPFVSYFSYLGFFILAYMVVALIWISIVRRKFDVRMLLMLIVLSLGYVAFEYRLFAMMLLSDEVTIRETMVLADFSFSQAMGEAKDVFVNNSFHADALTAKLVMPVCMIFFIINNLMWIIKRQFKKIFTSVYNLIILTILFNSLVYGLYTVKIVRDILEAIVPQLSGFQFDRTSFFNPFLWVCALFMVCKELTDICLYGGGATIAMIRGKILGAVAVILPIMYLAIIMLTPTRYNDLRITAWNTVKTVVYGNEIDDFSYREFYGEELFKQAKEDIGYDGEWSVAYGLYPAVLEFNGINTLDGYLGFYSQEYKDKFRKVIAPALDRVEASRIYYDNWGARAYIYSGTQDSAVRALKSFTIDDKNLYINPAAFADLGGKYIFSRYELDGVIADSPKSNETADAKPLNLVGTYSAQDVPYSLYVYTIE